MMIQKFSSRVGSGRWCWTLELEAGGTRQRRWGPEFLLLSWLTHCFKCPYHQKTSGANMNVDSTTHGSECLWKEQLCFQRQRAPWSWFYWFWMLFCCLPLGFFFVVNIGGIWLEKVSCSLVLFSYCSQETLNIRNAMSGLHYFPQAMKSSHKGPRRFL